MWRCARRLPTPPAAGVQDYPYRVVGVKADFNEVISGAECSELARGALIQVVVDDGLVVVFAVPGFAGRGAGVATPHACGNRCFYSRKETVKVVRKVSGLQAGLDRNHAAADVDADGGGHDCAFGGYHRSDGRAKTEMGVRHQREVTLDERHLCGPRCLGGSSFVQIVGPRKHVGLF